MPALPSVAPPTRVLRSRPSVPVVVAILGALLVTGAGTTATYTLDGAGNRTAETLNGVTTSFDLDLSLANPTILSDGTRTFLPGDPSAGYAQAGTWWSALTDQLGSPLLNRSGFHGD